MAMKITNVAQQEATNLLREFVKEILRRAKLNEPDGSFDETYVNEMTEELQKRVGIMVMEELSAEALDTYTKMRYEQNAEPNALSKFLEANIKDFAQKREKVLEDFAVRILQTANTMKTAMA